MPQTPYLRVSKLRKGSTWIRIQTKLSLTDTKNLSRQVSFFMNEMLGKLIFLSADAASKVDEIHMQLLSLQRQCSYRDRPLCDTLKVKTFEELAFLEKLNSVSAWSLKLKFLGISLELFHFLQLNQNPSLQRLSIINEDGHDNDLVQLTEELFQAKKSFRSYSTSLKQKFQRQNQEILKHMTAIRGEYNGKVNKLSTLVKHVLRKLSGTWETLFTFIDTLIGLGYKHWLIGLTACVAAFVVTFFTQVPLTLACCRVETFAGSFSSFRPSSSSCSVFCLDFSSFSSLSSVAMVKFSSVERYSSRTSMCYGNFSIIRA